MSTYATSAKSISIRAIMFNDFEKNNLGRFDSDYIARFCGSINYVGKQASDLINLKKIIEETTHLSWTLKYL